MRLSFVLLCVLPAVAWTTPVQAAPYIPANGAQVLERLPSRADPRQRELLRLRTELNARPGDVARAALLARRHIEQARRDGDPRHLGYAQAALAPWWSQATPPDQVLVLRATLRQSTHQFRAALADLDQAVRHDSDNAQAWLTRSTVQLVTGDAAGARASCMRLYARAPALVVQACLSGADSVSGRARAAYEGLRLSLAAHPDAPAELRGWAATLLAEMAARLGDADAAESWFRSALAADSEDAYLLGAYADFLLDQGRAAEVPPLLRTRTSADALLLRHAIALKALGLPEAARHSAMLEARFDAAMRRADNVHLREQARFELALRGDAAAAVRLAKLNWAVQKEPADLRILAQAAAASQDPAARALVEAWLRQSRLEDATLAPVLRRLDGVRA